MTEYTVNIYNWSGVTASVGIKVSYNDDDNNNKSSTSSHKPLVAGDNLTTPGYSFQFTVPILNWVNLNIEQPQGDIGYTILSDSQNVFNVWILDDPDLGSLTHDQAKKNYPTSKTPPSTGYIVQGDQYMVSSGYTFPTGGTILLVQGPALSTLTEVDTFTTPDSGDSGDSGDSDDSGDAESTSWTWLWWTLGVLAIILLVVITGYLIWRKKKSSDQVETEDDDTEIVVY